MEQNDKSLREGRQGLEEVNQGTYISIHIHITYGHKR